VNKTTKIFFVLGSNIYPDSYKTRIQFSKQAWFDKEASPVEPELSLIFKNPRYRLQNIPWLFVHLIIIIMHRNGEA